MWNTRLLEIDLRPRMLCPQPTTATNKSRNRAPFLMRCIRGLRRWKSQSSVDRNGRIALLVCDDLGVILPECWKQHVPLLVTPEHRTRCLQLLRVLIGTGGQGKLSVGVMTQHISVTPHPEHAKYISMPRDLVSDMAWNVRLHIYVIPAPPRARGTYRQKHNILETNSSMVNTNTEEIPKYETRLGPTSTKLPCSDSLPCGAGPLRAKTKTSYE